MRQPQGGGDVHAGGASATGHDDEAGKSVVMRNKLAISRRPAQGKSEENAMHLTARAVLLFWRPYRPTTALPRIRFKRLGFPRKTTSLWCLETWTVAKLAPTV